MNFSVQQKKRAAEDPKISKRKTKQRKKPIFVGSVFSANYCVFSQLECLFSPLLKLLRVFSQLFETIHTRTFARTHRHPIRRTNTVCSRVGIETEL